MGEIEIGKCWVCGKNLMNGPLDIFYHFHDLNICKTHKGAKEWYDGIMKLGNEKFARINGDWKEE